MLFRDLGLTCGLLFLVRLFLLVAAANPTAFALDPSKTITQYNHQVWKTHDGLPSNSVPDAVTRLQKAMTDQPRTATSTSQRGKPWIRKFCLVR
jgi:hypothetical protein